MEYLFIQVIQSYDKLELCYSSRFFVSPQEPDYPRDSNDKFIETICDLVRDYWKVNCSEKSNIDHRKIQQSFLEYFNNLIEKPSTCSDQQNTIEYCKCLSSNSSDEQWTQNVNRIEF